MTDNTAHDTTSTRDGETSPPLNQNSAATTATKKAAPRRKVASRPKAADVVEAGETDGAMVKKTVKARKPRAKAVPAALDDASTEPAAPVAIPAEAPTAQSERLSPPEPIAAPEDQAHIKTQVISPETYRALEQKTAQRFGHDGGRTDGAPSPAPEAPRMPVTRAASEAVPVPAAATPPPSGDAAVVPPETMHSPAEAAPSGVPAEPPHRPFEQGPRGDYRPSQDRPQDGRQQDRQNQDRQNRSFDRSQQQGGRQDNRRDRSQQGGGQYQHDRPQGNDRQQGQYGNDRQGGGQFNRRDRDRDRDQPGQNQPSFDQGSQGQPGMDGSLVSRPAEAQYGEGIVEVSGKGFGFLREAKRSFVQTPADIFVTPEVCRKYNLRDGQWIKGEVRRSSRGPQLFRLTELNGKDPEQYRNLPNFEELTTINPKKRIKLETVPERYTTRVMDLMTPIGKGQRGLIVAPPRTGKTTLLQHIAEAVIQNHPEMKVIILLVDERPEEVTEMRRTVPQAEIMASSNDSDLKSHTRIAQLAMERGKRLVEAGFDVFMLLDSITRMGRAFNNTATGSRTGSGGIDSRALEIPRKIFAAARNTEEAGSLTIMATALIDTGSRGDEVIFLEFKGTGNMELVLDRKISDQRIYPAVDIFQSGTRREELLLQPWELDKINVIRRGLAGHKPLEAIERLLSFLKKFPTNAQMLMSLPG